MSGVKIMYNLRPIIEQNMVESVSKCMYPMKNIHEKVVNHVDTTITDQNNFELQEMVALEERQKLILQQCEKLKAQIQKISAELNLKQTKLAQPLVTKSSKPIDITNFEDLSIKVIPSKIPYFLLLIKKSLENVIHLNIKPYIQNKISSKDIQSFNQCFGASSLTKNLPVINIYLIWCAEGDDTELIASPTQLPITGESNILRLFARLAPNSLAYSLETSVNKLKIDEVLSVCDELSCARTKTDKLNCLRDLNALLGKSDWIADTDHQTIADLASFNVIKQLDLSKDLSVKMSKWFKRFEN